MTDARHLLNERGLRLKIARTLGITHGAVYQWQQIPAQRVLEVERITGIPRSRLRPDLYPETENAA